MRIPKIISNTILNYLISAFFFIGFAQAEIDLYGYVSDLENVPSTVLTEQILKVSPNVLQVGTGSGTVLYRAKNGGAIVHTASHVVPVEFTRSVDASNRPEPEKMWGIAVDWKTDQSQVYRGSLVFSEELPQVMKVDRWVPSLDFNVIQLNIPTPVNNLEVNSAGIPRFILGFANGRSYLVYSLCNKASDADVQTVSNSATYPIDEDVEGLALCQGTEGMSGGGVFDIDGNYMGHLIRAGNLPNGESFIRYVKASFVIKTLKLKMKDYSVLN